MTMCKNEMKFHMLISMNAWMMLVLMKCKCKLQCLTQRCYISHHKDGPIQNMKGVQ